MSRLAHLMYQIAILDSCLIIKIKIELTYSSIIIKSWGKKFGWKYQVVDGWR